MGQFNGLGMAAPIINKMRENRLRLFGYVMEYEKRLLNESQSGFEYECRYKERKREIEE